MLSLAASIDPSDPHMASDSEPRDVAPRTGGLPRFQFSLWALLVTITVAAVMLGLWPTVGDVIIWVASIIVLVILPVPVVIAAIFARGDIQAASIGALTPLFVYRFVGLPTYYTMSGNQLTYRYGIALIGTVVLAAICAGLAVLARRWLERRGLLRF
jgi:hypothetical protein